MNGQLAGKLATIICLRQKMNHPQNPRVELDVVTFARGDNGMVLGQAVGTQVRFGEDQAQGITRVFIDHDHAVEWGKNKCREYCGRDDIDFLVREGDPIIQPATQMPMPPRRAN